ncbi:MAG: hypothetical protein KIS87_13570 [Phycisphaeraceae bacterium]|nr:hypothetical protein [Phycisphaeraceae bacterium]
MDVLAARPEVLPPVEFSDSDDEVIRKAFEELRGGLAVDRFLADPALTKRFNSLCRRLGVKQSSANVNRRLLRLRKATGGGRLRPATIRDVHPRLTERIGPAAESAMVKMLVRFGASVDDILADPELGEEYEAFARLVIDDGTALEYRLCALQIRKSRHLSKQDRMLFEELDPVAIVDEFIDLGTIAEPEFAKVPEGDGIVVLCEPSRPLFLSRFRSLIDGAQTLARESVVRGLGGDSVLWDPDTDAIRVRAIEAESLPVGPVQLWELRLISEWRPTFNWPVRPARAA